jgi:hypothetical protein
MSKDSPERVESVKNKVGKSRKSNPDEIRLGAKNDIMFRAKRVFFLPKNIYSDKKEDWDGNWDGNGSEWQNNYGHDPRLGPGHGMASIASIASHNRHKNKNFQTGNGNGRRTIIK